MPAERRGFARLVTEIDELASPSPRPPLARAALARAVSHPAALRARSRGSLESTTLASGYSNKMWSYMAGAGEGRGYPPSCFQKGIKGSGRKE
jgi:hypothetical protein